MDCAKANWFGTHKSFVYPKSSFEVLKATSSKCPVESNYAHPLHVDIASPSSHHAIDCRLDLMVALERAEYENNEQG